jgi:peroxin-11B
MFIEGMRDARKLFRLFKSLMEYQKIIQLQKQKMPNHKKVLNILSRLGFLFYWVFDNLQILSKVKFLDGVDTTKAAKRACFFWLLGLIFSIALVLVQMYETNYEEA